MKKYRKKKREFSKAIVAIVIILNSVFTMAVLFVFLAIGSEPQALIAAWFAFTTGELWMLTSIKKQKVKKEEKEYEGRLAEKINE